MKLKKKLYISAALLAVLLVGCARGEAKAAYAEESTQRVRGSYEVAEAGVRKGSESA